MRLSVYDRQAYLRAEARFYRAKRCSRDYSTVALLVACLLILFGRQAMYWTLGFFALSMAFSLRCHLIERRLCGLIARVEKREARRVRARTPRYRRTPAGYIWLN